MLILLYKNQESIYMEIVRACKYAVSYPLMPKGNKIVCPLVGMFMSGQPPLLKSGIKKIVCSSMSVKLPTRRRIDKVLKSVASCHRFISENPEKLTIRSLIEMTLKPAI